MNKRNLLTILFSIIVLILLIYFLDFNLLYKILSSISIQYIILSVLLYGLSYIFRGLRFLILINEHHVSILKILPIVYIHGFYNRLLPIRTGEVFFVYLANKYLKITKSKGIIVLLYARIFDLFTLLMFFLIALPFVIDYMINFNIIAVFSIVAICLIIMLLTFLPNILKFIKRKFLNRYFDISLNKRANMIFLFLSNKIDVLIIETKERKKFMLVMKLVLISAMNWISIFGMFFILLKGFKINITFAETIFGSTFANLSNVLPLSAVGGFGTMEAGWTIGFTLIGLERSLALTTGIAVNMFAFFTISMFGIIGIAVNKLMNLKNTEVNK